MAFGNKQRAPKQQLVIEFDHAGRTYRVELPGTEFKGDDPHPLHLAEFFSGVWKFQDLASGQSVYGNLSSFGPIRHIPQTIQG
nr:hypothetical protein [Rhodococcus sp. (in: high G+C Gram-positive bacteria)]